VEEKMKGNERGRRGRGWGGGVVTPGVDSREERHEKRNM